MPTTKQLVTHQNPHLDDVAAIWYLQRFVPAWKNAKVKFVPADSKKPLKDTKSVVHIGVGHGQFDEHKGNKADSATTLVWKWMKKQRSVKLTAVQKRALAELADYVNQEDHGLLYADEQREYMIGSVFTYLPQVTKKGSRGSLDFGLKYLDAVYLGLVQKHGLLKDWSKRKEFKTPWGRGVAIQTKASSKVLARVAYSRGFNLFVYKNPQTKYASIKAHNDSKVNLTKAYAAVKDMEPKAEWYLHHSKKMLICGSDVAANLFLSKMSLAKLIALVKK